MTVTYIQHVPTADKAGAFLRLLAIWRGGVFKGIWKNLLFYMVLYAGISLFYRFVLSNPDLASEMYKSGFERLCVYMGKYGDIIPLGFILGFYVTQVVNRFWTQLQSIPYLDSLCMNLTSYMPGNNMKQTRRLITRWAMLANILTLRRISVSVAKRFPTYEHLIDTGLMTEKEMKRLEELDQTTEGLHATAWYPIQWAQVALRKAKDAGSISSDFLFDKLQSNLLDISSKNGTLLTYAWINIPLVYTQLVTIAVHSYFGVTLLGRQYLNPTRYVGAAGDYIVVKSGTADSVNLVGYDDSILDFYVPFFSILQFIFYFGWINVAEVLINPFGEDDEDIDVNYIIDRNFQIGYLMVSGEEEDEEPEEDTYGDKIPPASLPHTVSSYKTKEPAPVLPADNILLTETEEDMVLMENADTKELLPSTHQRKTSIRSVTLSQYGKQTHHTAIEMIRTKLQTFKTNNGEQIPSPPVEKESTSNPKEAAEQTEVETSENVDWEEIIENGKEEGSKNI